MLGMGYLYGQDKKGLDWATRDGIDKIFYLDILDVQCWGELRGRHRIQQLMTDYKTPKISRNSSKIPSALANLKALLRVAFSVTSRDAMIGCRQRRQNVGR
jgi:hypothetical protein